MTREDAGVLITLLGAVFLAVLDLAVANVALPGIGVDLKASGGQLQLVVGAYVSTYAVLLITGARVGHRRGAARVFRLGVVIFTAASLGCSVAWNPASLIVLRAVQGVGAAAMVPQVVTLIQIRFVGAARARALSWYAAVIAGGAIAGQIFGGVLVQADVLGLGWRTVFLVNVPVGAAVAVNARRRLPPADGDARAGLDGTGLIVLSAGVLAVVLPLVLGGAAGWPAWTWWSLTAGVVLLVSFGPVERSVGRRGGAPLVAGELVRAPGFGWAALAVFLALANYGAILFVLTLYVQRGLGHGALAAGLVFLPSAAAFAPASLGWRRLPQRWHRRMIPAALVLSGVALLGVADATRRGHVDAELELSILLFGTGMGFAFSPLMSAGLARVPQEHAAGASGVLTTVNQLGQVVGVAVYGTTFLHYAHDRAAVPHAAAITALLMAGGAGLAAMTAVGVTIGEWRRGS